MQLQIDNFLDGIVLGQSFTVQNKKRRKALRKFDVYFHESKPSIRVEQATLLLVGDLDKPNRIGLVQLCGLTARKRKERRVSFLPVAEQAIDLLDRLLNPKAEEPR